MTLKSYSESPCLSVVELGKLVARPGRRAFEALPFCDFCSLVLGSKVELPPLLESVFHLEVVRHLGVVAFAKGEVGDAATRQENLWLQFNPINA